MKRKIMALFDTDAVYAVHFAEYAGRRSGIPFEVHAFTDREALEAFVRKEKVELLLVSSAEADGDGAIIEEMSCPCGARLVRRLIAYHGVCPECGGEIARRDGLLVCMDCRRTSSEDFSGDFIEVRDRLVMPGNLG
jgi:predicted RNA-binding Zn-ribbon protein involved in translation (DUF1610 family)